MNEESRSASPWVSADPGQWACLTEGQVSFRYPRKSIIYYQGYQASYLYIVESGRVRITTYMENGLEKQMFIAERGSLFGEVSAFTGLRYRCSAVAIVDSRVFRIPKEEAAQKLREGGTLAENLVDSLCRKMLMYQQQILDLSFAQAHERIAQLLINLCAQYGHETPEGTEIGIRFSHQDVANMINASRVTVSNIFAQLLRDGILQKGEKFFIVVDMEALRTAANPGQSAEMLG